MKPTLAPPRHSSTPTCTFPCCAEVVATDADKARAIAARASERRMNKSPDQVRVLREQNVPIWRVLYGTTGAARPDGGRLLGNRDRGESRDSSPPTPPDIRVRRFNGLGDQ